MKNKIGNDICIKEDTVMHGMIIGSVKVVDHAKFTLQGATSGHVIIENSTAFIRGIVGGNVINKNGHLEVFGKVIGKILKEGGETIIHPTAKLIAREVIDE